LPAGVFRIALDGADDDGNASGDFDITGAVTVRGAGAGATVVDGRQKDRVFDVLGSASRVVFQGLTVRNGNVIGHGGGVQAGNAAGSSGGGLDVRGPDLSLDHSSVRRNSATGIGGGIHADSVTVKGGSAVGGNVAVGFGGGIAAAAATVTGSTVSGNTSLNGF